MVDIVEVIVDGTDDRLLHGVADALGDDGHAEILGDAAEDEQQAKRHGNGHGKPIAATAFQQRVLAVTLL